MWEREEGVLWRELFVELADAADGDTTTSAGDYSYAVPTNFRLPGSGTVWVGSGASQIPYKVIPQERVQTLENDFGNWCYFKMDGTPTLEFNPNLTLDGGQTISYTYYKKASSLSSGSDTFEMSDPMFAVYYALAELKKEEGNQAELALATQKLEAMRVRNMAPSWYQEDSFLQSPDDGFGV